MLQVQVHYFFAHRAGVLENNRPDLRFTAPFPKLLLALSSWPQRVHRVGPTRIGAGTLIECREDESRQDFLADLTVWRWLQGLRAEHFQCTGNCRLEVPLIQARPVL